MLGLIHLTLQQIRLVDAGGKRQAKRKSKEKQQNSKMLAESERKIVKSESKVLWGRIFLGESV